MTLSLFTKYTDELSQRGNLYPGGFSYHAQLYGPHSCFGIDHGPLSKLAVYDRKGRQIIHYDGGWIVRPGFFQWKRRAVLRAILAHYDRAA